MGADNTFISKATEALREIAERWGFQKGYGDNLLDLTNECYEHLTTIISEHYYPKEFLEWLRKNTDHECDGKWYVFKLMRFLTTEEAFNYWKEEEQ